MECGASVAMPGRSIRSSQILCLVRDAATLAVLAERGNARFPGLSPCKDSE